ncbi:hypothetical protein FHR99_001105 [Litorivivens lipolytica]|uniref:Uncharacterized protein n=1 Tax=Litorivivens lipolytica TaxID=1524264 RepID=A0A7W4W3S4_9GAMM|nr:hypothetical protein [Litorivivens lipolytica]MBB3046869.1 hypothetical protein [Litorivivens lipolytica]
MTDNRLKQVQLDHNWLSNLLSTAVADHSDLTAVGLTLSLQSDTCLVEGESAHSEVESLAKNLQKKTDIAEARWAIQFLPDEDLLVFSSEKALLENATSRLSGNSGDLFICALHIPYMPASVLTGAGPCTANALSKVTKVLRDLGEDILREVIGQILKQGIQTDTSLPNTDREWQIIVDALKAAPSNDLLPLLELSGFADQSLGESGEMEDGQMVLRCQECIYYLPRRKWCDLPELPLPVEAHWYCRLWKL